MTRNDINKILTLLGFIVLFLTFFSDSRTFKQSKTVNVKYENTQNFRGIM